jgi:hypothetical protein
MALSNPAAVLLSPAIRSSMVRRLGASTSVPVFEPEDGPFWVARSATGVGVMRLRPRPTTPRLVTCMIAGGTILSAPQAPLGPLGLAGAVEAFPQARYSALHFCADAAFVGGSSPGLSPRPASHSESAHQRQIRIALSRRKRRDRSARPSMGP